MKDKTRIRLAWWTSIIIPIIVVFAVHKEMNDVASAGLLAYTGIIGGYIAGKTINNNAHINKGEKS
jgi:hydrogenase/urease accessory protein HupE